MDTRYCYAYVEDSPSAEAMKKIVAYRNSISQNEVAFIDGFPAVTRGFGQIKKKAPRLVAMANAGNHALVMTDLDTAQCPAELIRDWFGLPLAKAIALPPRLVFRVAVRSVESWILADHRSWAGYIGIPAANFSDTPECLPNPKQHLLDVIRRKGRRARHKAMLPHKSAHVGPEYNNTLCSFIRKEWSPERALAKSESLRRMIVSLTNW